MTKKTKKIWERNYRSDRGIWEDTCPHGVGHCNDVHGCDGCCVGLYNTTLNQRLPITIPKNAQRTGDLGRVAETPIVEEWEKEFDLIWGIAPPDSLKGQRGQLIKDLITTTREQVREQTRREMVEIIKKLGHQQDDDTIWCNMDEILSALTKLK